MKNGNLEKENDDICEVFCSHEDAVARVKEQMLLEEEYFDLSEFFKIFGNPTRLKIISLLCVEDLCVCDISEALEEIIGYKGDHSVVLDKTAYILAMGTLADKSVIDGGMREGLVFRSYDGQESFKAVSNPFLLKYHS